MAALVVLPTIWALEGREAGMEALPAALALLAAVLLLL